MSDPATNDGTASAHRARFAFDWGAGRCLWPEAEHTEAAFGSPVDHHALPMPADLAVTLDGLCDEFESALNWDEPLAPGPWRQPQCDRFNARVAEAISRLRSELGAAWEITDAHDPLTEDPDLDRYLADPDGFHR